MTRRMEELPVALRYSLVLGVILAAPLGAQQEPVPAPEEAPTVEIGLFGFGARVGLDVDEDAHGVIGYSLDLGHLFSDRLRLRPSAEIGIQSGANNFVGSAELIYRFTPDREVAIPYVGMGFALAGSTGCASDPDCPSLWLQFALGFEVRLRDQFNWMLEYHAEDALRRHRLFVGLTTRRAP